MGKKEEKHLPVYGIGPMLCWKWFGQDIITDYRYSADT